MGVFIMNPIFSALISPITGIIEKLVPDKDKAAQIAFEIATLTEKNTHAQILGQLKVNEAEAAHKSLFVAGWRPFIGWVCGVAMAFNFIVIPFVPELVPLSLETMMPVLMGMLGLGGMRSYEKRNGVAREK
jgi:hypothetical protein